MRLSVVVVAVLIMVGCGAHLWHIDRQAKYRSTFEAAVVGGPSNGEVVGVYTCGEVVSETLVTKSIRQGPYVYTFDQDHNLIAEERR